MARKYEQRRRAEKQAETRRRIVEAAIELHCTKGPASTTVTDVARLAGVQRHTLYRHFPDERSLHLACSGLYTELHPAPDPSGWPDDPAARRRVGLAELYSYFARNEAMFTRVLRDAEVHTLTAEVLALWFGPPYERIRAALAEGLPAEPRAQAALDLALDFHAWRRLVRGSGLSNEGAAALMAAAIACQ
jgi:AcrR family transcriptional regulator